MGKNRAKLEGSVTYRLHHITSKRTYHSAVQMAIESIWTENLISFCGSYVVESRGHLGANEHPEDENHERWLECRVNERLAAFAPMVRP